jgi:transcriptional regulator with XRE-family HTH domain
MAPTKATAPAALDSVNAARGRALRELLSGERWTGRSAAMRLGVNYAYVNRRLLGEVELSFSDVQAFAPLVQKSDVELFAYLANVDSTVGPAGIEPTTSTVEERRFDVIGENVVALRPGARQNGTTAAVGDRVTTARVVRPVRRIGAIA